MNWNDLDEVTPDGDEVIVHLHMSVVKRHRMEGEGMDIRLMKFTMSDFRIYYKTIMEYALDYTEHKVYCAAHFQCGCSKKFFSHGKRVSDDEELDVLCDEHWKQEVLGIPAKVRYVK